MSDSLEGFGPPEPDLSAFGPPESGVNAGEAPPVAEDPAAQRRALMAVQPDAGTVDLAAYRASRADLAPDKAAMALVSARQTGLSPEFAADNLDQIQRQQMQGAITEALTRAPGVAAYAGQSAVHASAVKNDLDNLSFLEWAITGKWEHVPGASMIGGGQVARNVTPPFWWAALKGALSEQKFVAMTTKEAVTGLNLDEEEQLRQLESQLGGGGDFGAKNKLTRAMVGAVKALPSLAVIGGAEVVGAVGGTAIGAATKIPGAQQLGKEAGKKAGAILGQFYLSFGPLYHQLTQLERDDGMPVLTDDEARLIAGVGAFSTAAVATTVGGPLLEKLPGVREILGKIGGGALAQVVARPGIARALADAGAKFGKNYAAGIAMMIAQSVGNEATIQAAKASHGQGADLGKIGAAAVNAGLQAAQDLPLIAAYEPIVSTIGGVVRARAEAAQLGAMVDKAKASKLSQASPEEAQAVISQATGRPGAADVAYVDKEAWDRHWRAQGEDPSDIAAQVNGDQGRAYAEAEASGGPVAVKMEKHLTDLVLSGDAEKLAQDTKLSPDSMTPNEAKEATDNLSGAGQAIPGAPLEPTPTEAASYKDAALEMLNGKPIGEIRPDYYAQAGRRMGQRAVDLAGEQDKTGLGDVQRRQAFNVVAERFAREVRAEMDKLQTRIGKVDRDALAAGDPAYLSAYDAMMGALEGQGSPGALDGALAKMQSEARSIGFDEAAVADLLANPRPFSKLTPPEARNLADAVASIRKAAKDANEIAVGDRRASLREFVAGVAQYAAEHGPGGGAGSPPGGIPPPNLPPPSNAGKGKLERAGETLRALGTEGVRAEVILRRLGPGGDQVVDSFTKARNYHETLARDVGEAIYKAVEKLPKALKKTRTDGVEAPGSPVVDDSKWVRQDLWNLAGWFGSESGAQRLRDGLRISDDQVRAALEQLTKPEAEHIDALHALNDEKLWPLIRDHEVASTGTSPPKIEARPYTLRLSDGEIHTFRGGYWPGVDANPKPRAPDGTVAGFWGTLRDGFPATAKSFVNERSERTAYRPDLNWSAYSGHVSAVLRYLAYDDFVRNAGKIVTDRQFRQVLTDQQGPQSALELDKFLSVSARGYVESAKDGAAKWGAIVGGGFRSRIATGAFQLNLPVVIGQLSHVPAMAAGLRIAPWHMLEGLGKAFVPGSWAEAHANSEQLPYRWNGYGQHMREMLSAVGPNEPATPRRWLDAAGWSLYHGMDGFLSKVLWEAGRAKAKAAGLDEASQFKEGDKAVSAGMPPLNLAEQSSLARDRGLIGSLLLVRNFPNTLYNVGAMNAWQARTGIWAANPGLQRAGAIVGQTTLAAASYLGMVWSAHIFGRFLMGHGRQEDESTAEWLTRDALAAPFYPIPFGGVAEPIAAAVTANVARDKPIAQTLLQHNTTIQSAPALALLENAIHDFGLAMSENRMDSDRMYAAAKLAASVLRLPVYPLKPARYAYDLFQGDVQPRGPLDVAGGFLYGQRPRQVRNPLTAAQDVLSGE